MEIFYLFQINPHEQLWIVVENDMELSCIALIDIKTKKRKSTRLYKNCLITFKIQI